MTVKKNVSIPSMYSCTAAAEEFMAPDSIASRPNPGSLEDRPLKPRQVPKSVIEADLKQNS
jgi:hypothetical protein